MVNLRHRRLEDVDYWRKQSGWYDDDESMVSYNKQVYNNYQDGTNAPTTDGNGGYDNYVETATESSTASAASASTSSGYSNFTLSEELIIKSVKLVLVGSGFIIAILFVRAVTRKLMYSDTATDGKSNEVSSSRIKKYQLKDDDDNRSRRTRSRSRKASRSVRSKSRGRSSSRIAGASRSRSRTRPRRDDSDEESNKYNLMEEESSNYRGRSKSQHPPKDKNDKHTESVSKKSRSRSRAKRDQEMLV